MPNTCCGPKCNTCYKCDERQRGISLVSFPKDSEKSKVKLRKTNRDNCSLNKNSYVSETHFDLLKSEQLLNPILGILKSLTNVTIF